MKVWLWTKRLIIVVVAVQAVGFLLILGMTVFSRYGAEHRVDEPTKEPNCEQYGTRLLDNLKSAVDRGDSECFIRILHKSHLANRGYDLDISAYLAEQLSNPKSVPSLFRDDYVRLEALNIIVPWALAGDLSFDTRGAHTYLREQTESKNAEVRKLALVVLSYYRDDADVETFRKHALAQSDSEVSISVHALAELCSPKAKEALRWALSQDRVKMYLRKYHDKETLTALIARKCPLN